MTGAATMAVLCRDCLHLMPDRPPQETASPCPQCRSRRRVAHAELTGLSLAHLDCDAFYASVEKRDNPDLARHPLIIGGGDRGVVSTACYIARMSGVRSAMPMSEARRRCPDAIVLPPDMAKYRRVGQAVRELMTSLTPLVEPLSIDEAFMDLAGTERLFGTCPAVMLADLARRVEADLGITVSIGLAPNKFLAKLASDMDKPRGFTVIGAAEAPARLAPMPISAIFGIGARTAATLQRDGLSRIGQLQTMNERGLMQRYGETGLRLARLSRGIDPRPVTPDRPAKSVSSETTLSRDLRDKAGLEAVLWRQCERTASDLKTKTLAGLTVTLKLKTSTHKTISRSHTLDAPTQLATTLFEEGRHLLAPLVDGTPYRLVGIGVSNFRPVQEADPPDLIEPARTRRASAERAMDALRARYGHDSVQLGRALGPDRGETAPAPRRPGGKKRRDE
ncbi:DNA polymerase IV [Yunchengibacter salinarum]|uniref:DNA polymerase IV n=1 Tax=Yunchengibacter salinarum TaxID=3133399 RepID=UPI0035B59B9E